MIQRGIFLAGVLLLMSARLVAAELAPLLSPEEAREVHTLLHLKESENDFEAAEMRYQQLVHRQILTDLIQVYSPENRTRLEITFPDFRADDEKPRGDLGFGLAVLKRLRLDLSDGTEKVIEVNEHWAENRTNGGLFAPDEIRVKTLAFEGKRFVPGSQALYLFDVLRVAWGPAGREAKLCRRTRYRFEPQTGYNRTRAMRVPVSSPYSCVGCHLPDNVFAKRFLEPGEPRNYEAIVQNRYFQRPPDATSGFQRYVARLREEGREDRFVARVERDLARPRETLMPDGILAALRRVQAGPPDCWLGPDLSLDDDEFSAMRDWQGVYQSASHGPFLDALERLIGGKYEEWVPVTRFPSVKE